MVEDRVTDGKRIAQLLSSELTGLDVGPLAAVSVVDADPDAEPSEDGTVAYAVVAGDHRIGDVVLYPDAAELAIERGIDTARETARRTAIPVAATGGDELAVTIESGAAVKGARDVVRDVADALTD
jgi:hypothetical protein